MDLWMKIAFGKWYRACSDPNAADIWLLPANSNDW